MGCDIHLFAERRDGGIWVPLHPISSASWQEDSARMRDLDPGRDYCLFGVLAGVRREAGPEGPLATPGIPDDASEEYRNIVDWWSIDGHSHSHATLSTLLAHDWTTVTDDWPWANKDWTDLLADLAGQAKTAELTTDDVRLVFFFDN